MKLLKYCLGIPLFFALNTFAQQSPTKDISGKVSNDRGEPLVNANVTIKNGKGIATNVKGQFLLKNVAATDFLQISYIGYNTQTFAIKDQSIFNIVLKPAENELDKVVIQAYGTTSKRLATGNISSITAEEISKHPIMNPIQILQGNIPGAVITNASGSASSSVKIEIRGRNTVDQNIVSEPLYIIDGVPMTVLNLASNIKTYAAGSIVSQGVIQSGIGSDAGGGQSQFFGVNPNDIERIEVLKDADATAIYGSRAANGVILITTKKGRAGKTNSEITVFTGYSQVARYYPLLNTSQYISMRKEALMNDGLPVNLQTAPDLLAWDTTRYTDWQKYIYGTTGRRTSVQGSISGGDMKTSFRASAGYDYDRDIITERGGNSRTAFSLNLNHKSLNQKFNLTWSSLYSFASIEITNRSASVLLPPNAPAIYDNRGNLNYAGWNPLTSNYPFGGLLENYVSKTNYLNSNITMSYEIISGLMASTSVGYNNSQNSQTKKIPIASQNPAINPRGTLRDGRTNFSNIIVEPKIEYSTFISKGKLAVLVGGTVQVNKTQGLMNNGTNYTNDLLLTSINNATNINVIENYGEYKYSGLYGRINYNWTNKYLFNVNVRRDGSSRFGPGRQFGNFGSVGAGWIFSEENWIKNNPILSFGKLRGSYGITGSDNIIDYQYLSLWQFGGGTGTSGTYNSTIPIIPLGFSDSLLQWEVNKKLELSLQLGFINDRISFEVSWYRHRSNNQLVSFPTPAMTGFTFVTSNTPANIENQGWEFLLNGKIFEKSNFKWSAKFSFALNRNKLLAYPNFSQSPYAGKYVIGQSLNIQKLLKSTGVNSQTGLYTFEDINKDGNITVDIAGIRSDDRYPVVLAPKFDGGFSTNLTYKHWDLSASFYYRKQKGVSILASAGIAGIISNQSTAILNRWQKPGDLTNTGKFTTTSTQNTTNYYNYSDAQITDASFIRLQNLSLSYRIPEIIKKKAGFGDFKIYVQAENLFIITKYNGIDPEIQSLGGMPRPRVITAGLSCNF